MRRLKVALLLGELELPFTTVPVDIFKGEQHGPAFRALNPNGKVPVLVDGGRFLPMAPAARAVALSWLQLVATGLSPFSGQAVHFLHYAPEPVPYAERRYLKEVERHYAVLEGRLATSPFLAGDEYTIADMALWGWARGAAYLFGEAGLSAYPHVAALVRSISARPAAVRAAQLGDQLQLKTADAETLHALFPFTAPPA